MTSAPRLMWLPPALNLALAALQILYLGPVLAADALSLALGVTWSLAIAIAWPSLSPGNRRLGAGYLLMSTGPLLMAYSRDLLLLYLGWEVVGLGLWLALTSAETNRSGRRALALALHVPGWLLLVVALLGLAPSFVAPAGGEAQAWPLPVALAFGCVVLARSGCWPFNGWPSAALLPAGWSPAALLGLYCLASPFLLARALVAAPWSPEGTWALALLGTLGLVAGATAAVSLRGARRVPAIASTHAAAALCGLALAPGSPLAAAGAVALLVSGGLWVAALPSLVGSGFPAVAGGWSILLGGSFGVWAIAQAALSLGYGILAVALLPAGALLALSVACLSRESSIVRRARRLAFLPVLGAAFCLFVGVFPQALSEWVVRPAVVAMSGGVGALRELSPEWGLGLAAGSPSETYAALPATGMALGVALALVALYWLSLLLGRFAHEQSEGEAGDVGEGHGPDLNMDSILPGAETVGGWLDLTSLLAKAAPRLPRALVPRDNGPP